MLHGQSVVLSCLTDAPVYNCRSDTTCEIQGNNGIMMSVTSFPDVPVTFAVMYGCTSETMEFVSGRLESYKRTALHPLMLPMMFVELERKRLLNALQSETSILDQRILDMQTRLSTFTKTGKPDNTKVVKVTESSEASSSTEASVSTEGGELIEMTGRVDKAKDNGKKDPKENTENMLEKDCKATKNWLMVSKLKNGVQSLIAILDAIAAHSQEFSEETEEDSSTSSAGNRGIYTSNTETFQDRLTEMVTELNSEVQNCDSLLGGMSMATQMVSRRNHIVRMQVLKLVANISGAGMEFLHPTRRQGEHHHRFRLQEGQQPDESHILHGHGLPPCHVLGGKHSLPPSMTNLFAALA